MTATETPVSTPTTFDDAAAPPVGQVSVGVAWSLLTLALLAGIAARLWYLRHAMAAPDFAWVDPDGYLAGAGRLLASGSWEWTAEAVHYKHRGRIFHLPPLYPVFLSVFGILPWSWPTSAAVAQSMLPAVTSVSVYAIGTTIHTRTAGLVAGLLVAIAPSFVPVGPVFMQEQLYLPLVFASIALLCWLLTGPRAAGWWVVAGLMFGASVLTRSMPLYFIPLAGAVVLWFTRHRARRTMELLLLVAGVLTVTLAYSARLSWDAGRWIFVEDHASISLTAYTGIIYSRPPSLSGELSDLVDAAVRNPHRFFGTFWDYFTAAFKLAGARWVQLYFGTVTGGARVALDTYATVFTDVAFAAGVVLAPFGLILARRRVAALVLATWPALVVLLTAIAAYGGPRYRSPFETLLFVFLGVVIARGWRRPAPIEIAAASATSLALFALIR